ncbi:MAG: type I 3-dehydroquinate dehydratase [Proteobacteria bacterium]|nr:type I 3-dehydroquinate dehydratase [Pseudomonadota bacterium]
MICVSIGNVSIEECISVIRSNQMSEVRLDLIEATDEDIKKIFSSGKNIIATCKINAKLTDNDRVSLLTKALDAGASYIDVEIDSSDDFKNKVIDFARSKGKKVIISYHNCKETPSREDLINIINRCKNHVPDAIKIACVSHSNNDNVRLLNLLDSDISMIVIGMGEKGRITRFVAPLLGAFCTFVGISQLNQTAFGQPTKEEIEEFLRSFKTPL